MSDEELTVMDWKRLRLFTDGDPIETAELIDLFTENADESIVSMCTLCTEQPSEAWKSAVHKLKGSAANLGADALAHTCKKAELAWTESYEIKQALVEDIVSAYDSLKLLLANPVLETAEDW